MAKQRPNDPKIILPPGAVDQRQLWILVVQHPADTRPGSFFITHFRNEEKFANKPGFQVLTEPSPNKLALLYAVRDLTAKNPNYQPIGYQARQARAAEEAANQAQFESLAEDEDGDGLPITEGADILEALGLDDPVGDDN